MHLGQLDELHPAPPLPTAPALTHARPFPLACSFLGGSLGGSPGNLGQPLKRSSGSGNVFGQQQQQQQIRGGGGGGGGMMAEQQGGGGGLRKMLGVQPLGGGSGSGHHNLLGGLGGGGGGGRSNPLGLMGGRGGEPFSM